MKIGFVGLGAMGFPMARHLAKEHEVLVWNRTAEKAQRHARDHGTSAVSDLRDIAAADVIITMLPTSSEVDEVVEKIAPALRKGTLWIDATSGGRYEYDLDICGAFDAHPELVEIQRAIPAALAIRK